MGMVLVIHERDSQDEEHCIIGVASGSDKANELLKEYYGKFKELSFHDIRDSNIEWSKTLEVLDHKGTPYKVFIWTEWFEIDKI